jgi:hypothetical protein
MCPLKIETISVRLSHTMDLGRRLPAKRKFTTSEDLMLREIVPNTVPLDWSKIASHFPDRNARQCRDRWFNYVNPVIVTAPWDPEEEALLEEKWKELGNRWKQISHFFPTRSANQIKNHWLARRPQAPPPNLAPPGCAETPGIFGGELPDPFTDLFPLNDGPRNPWESFF